MNKNIAKSIVVEHISDFKINTYVIEFIDNRDYSYFSIYTYTEEIIALKNFIYNDETIYKMLYIKFYENNEFYKQKYCDPFIALFNLDYEQFNEFNIYIRDYGFGHIIKIKTLEETIEKQLTFK